MLMEAHFLFAGMQAINPLLHMEGLSQRCPGQAEHSNSGETPMGRHGPQNGMPRDTERESPDAHGTAADGSVTRLGDPLSSPEAVL